MSPDHVTRHCSVSIPSLERRLALQQVKYEGDVAYQLSVCYAAAASEAADQLQSMSNDAGALHRLRGDVLLRLKNDPAGAEKEYSEALRERPRMRRSSRAWPRRNWLRAIRCGGGLCKGRARHRSSPKFCFAYPVGHCAEQPRLRIGGAMVTRTGRTGSSRSCDSSTACAGPRTNRACKRGAPGVASSTPGGLPGYPYTADFSIAQTGPGPGGGQGGSRGEAPFDDESTGRTGTHISAGSKQNLGSLAGPTEQ